MENKAKGMFMFLFIGDSMGSAYEFSRYTIRDDENAIHNGLITSYRRLKRFSSNYTFFEKGTVTDDSILTIELLLSLSLNETKNQRLRRYYDAVKRSSSFGKNTRALFKNLRYEENYYNQFGVYPPDFALNSPESNGCLMRCSSLALLSLDCIEDKIIEDVMITNPSQNCIDVIFAYIHLLRYGLNDEDPIEAIYKMKNKITNPELIKIVNICLNNQEYRDSKDPNKRGWVFVSFYYSLKGLLRYIDGIHFNRILPEIILEGGDTDTNAAITGALLGSFIGYEKLMEDDVTYTNAGYVKNHINWNQVKNSLSSITSSKY